MCNCEESHTRSLCRISSISSERTAEKWPVLLLLRSNRDNQLTKWETPSAISLSNTTSVSLQLFNRLPSRWSVGYILKLHGKRSVSELYPFNRNGWLERRRTGTWMKTILGLTEFSKRPSMQQKSQAWLTVLPAIKLEVRTKSYRKSLQFGTHFSVAESSTVTFQPPLLANS